MAGSDDAGPALKGRCPICGEPPVTAYRPFCSKRCADIDLSRWLSGAYAIAGSEDDDEDGDQDAIVRPPGMPPPPDEEED